ncbi:hypothetical protein HK104_000336, partial [Borealophlyctis nickersoniae]
NAEQQANDMWLKLENAIRQIYKKNAGTLSFEEIYRYAYTMVLHKMGDKLYSGVRDVIKLHLEQVAQDTLVPAFPQTQSSGGSLAASTGGAGAVMALSGGPFFLKEVKAVWDEHTTCLLMIRDILLYMDRVYVPVAKVPLVYDLGLDLFRDVVIRSKTYPIKKHLIDTILYQIHLEREGEMVDRSVIKSIVGMMLNLTAGKGDVGDASTVYAEDFESRFLETSQSFYSMESQQFLRECDAGEYLKRAEKRLGEEEQRTKQILSPSTEPKVRAIVEAELLENHVKAIIEMENSGLVPMVTNHKLEDLGRLYRLFARVSTGHPEIRGTISEHIKELGKAVNETLGGLSSRDNEEDAQAANAKRPSSASLTEDAGASGLQRTDPLLWVEGILALKDKFDKVLESSFCRDRAFQTDMNAALEHAVNQNPKAPEFVSLFIDENLRKGLKGKSEEEVDAMLDKTITLFRFIAEKDVFERYYKQHLAKRLLFGRSVSEDGEKSMIAKLKTECGYQFTTKLEGMFNDMRLSADTMSDFRAHLSSAITTPKGMVDISVNILTSTFWPVNTTCTAPTCHFPPEITASMETFQRFYLSRHSGRRLTWLTHMGLADLRATFDKGKKEINVSTFGMIVLVGVFNNVDEAVTYRRIREITDIPDPDLKRTLQSLSLAKYKILLKSSKGKEIKDTDTFTFNSAFTSPLSKLKILTISASSPPGSNATTGNSMETDAERADTLEKIDEARKHQIEAAIVRIMKSRKKMDHNNLVAEVMKQLSGRFIPSPIMVKKRIEGLIEREYLERDKTDRKHYNYLA